MCWFDVERDFVDYIIIRSPFNAQGTLRGTFFQVDMTGLNDLSDSDGEEDLLRI